jgi:hypothetical protein
VNATARQPLSPAVELAKTFAVLVWVAGATAVALAVLGHAPAWLAGEERHVRAVETLDDAARRAGARLYLPAYFPSRFAWPPARIRVAGGKGGSVAVTFDSVEDHGPALVLFQSTRPGDPVSPLLLGEPRVVHQGRTSVGTLPATLANVLVDGSMWQQLAWQVGGIQLVLRARVGDPELHRLAHALHREGSGP